MAILVRGPESAAAHTSSAPRPDTVGRRAFLSPGLSGWQRWAAVAGLAGASGLAVAWAAPRGPVTDAQAFGLLSLALVTGGVAGFVTRSRWAMLVAPVAHLLAFEIGRFGVVGPTVTAVRLDGMFQLLAFLTGRGVYALLALLPLALGASLGAALARRPLGEPRRRRSLLGNCWLLGRRVVTAMTAVALLALAWGFAQPAHTPPILGPGELPLPGSIATLEPVQIGGHEQWLSIRGHNTANPVLLHLAGGPGDSDIGDGSPSFRDLEQDFTVVIWDQRGTGKSYPALEPTATHTLDQAVADTIELSDYLRQRFGQPKIYLLGNSWGSILAVLAAQRAPELYYAVIGSGQMVSIRETDQLIYRDLLAYAERTGNGGLTRALQTYGEPPFADIYGNALLLTYYEELAPYTPPREFTERMQAAGIGFLGTMAPEYSLMDKVNLVRGLLDTSAVLYPQLQDLDFRRDVPRLEVPIHVVAGQYELPGRAALVPQWLDHLQAPRKQPVTFEQSAHAPHAQEASRFRDFVVRAVLAESRASAGPAWSK
jgi:proline iminopeptidase